MVQHVRSVRETQLRVAKAFTKPPVVGMVEAGGFSGGGVRADDAAYARSKAITAVMAAAGALVGLLGLLGLLTGPTHAQTPDSAPAPDSFPPLCATALPPAWSYALADPANLWQPGQGTLVGASPDASVRYLLVGDQLVELSDAAPTRRVVLTLPAATPTPRGPGGWTIDGTVDGDWFVFGLEPTVYSPAPGHLGLYAWDRRTGTLRVLQPLRPSPTVGVLSWTSGDGLVAWDTSPYPAGPLPPPDSHLIEDLANGRRSATTHRLLLLSGGLAVSDDPSTGPVAETARTGTGVAVPEALRRLLLPAWSEVTSDTAPGVLLWSTDPWRASPVGRTVPLHGWRDWNVWLPAAGSALRIQPPSGTGEVAENLVGDDFLVVRSVRADPRRPNGVGDEQTLLIDLRTRGEAPLPLPAAMDAPVFGRDGAPSHVLDLTTLPRLPGC